MSGEGNFIARWSRRKRAAAKPEAAPGETASEAAAAAPAETALFDPASLPPIESIGAGSDIRAFLAPGVPAHLTRAALRRAWAADPAIRDFIGLSENSWDFNAAGSMAGFGPISADEVRRLLAQAIGEPSPEEAAAAAPPSPAEAPPPAQLATASQTDPAPVDKNDTAAQHEKPESVRQDYPSDMPQRSHGGALPR